MRECQGIEARMHRLKSNKFDSEHGHSRALEKSQFDVLIDRLCSALITSMSRAKLRARLSGTRASPQTQRE
jgi:hypothetical protein